MLNSTVRVDCHGWCHICGFRIPQIGMSPHHDLYLTTDHVIPRFLGGGEEASNRMLAHRCCNLIKGTNILDWELRQRCIVRVLEQFKANPRFGCVLTGEVDEVLMERQRELDKKEARRLRKFARCNFPKPEPIAEQAVSA